MKPVARIGVVAFGYVAAIGLAVAAVLIRVAAGGPDLVASSGMSAFGDSILFIGVFGVAALVPTGAALYFLKPYRVFWQVISAVGLTIALASIVAAVIFAMGRDTATSSRLGAWAALSVVPILLAPPLALAFLLSALLSPFRFARLAFLAATLMEVAVSAYAGFAWLIPWVFNAP